MGTENNQLIHLLFIYYLCILDARIDNFRDVTDYKSSEYVCTRVHLPAGEIYVTFIYFKIVVVINVELLLKSPWSCLNRINQQLTNIFELWTHQTPAIKLWWSYGWVTMHLYKSNSFLRSAFVVYRDTYGLFINTFIWSTEMTKRKKKLLKDRA